ncbi:MAG: diguanylate cyclase [Niameybacter sp.]|uniref:sensor domain-containing diguanylate cyclase n=1 Tax=Niameybacter sp. TaxID=2033640 RepID=UPI002FC79B06
MKIEDLMQVPHKLRENQDYAKNLLKDIQKMNIEEARVFLEALIEVATKFQLDQAYPWIIYCLAWNMDAQGKRKQAIVLHEKGYALFEQQQNIEGQLSIANTLIGFYAQMGRLDEALKWSITALELGEKCTQESLLTTTKVNMALVYMERRELGEAIKLLEQVELYGCFNNRDREIILYINRAECECFIGNMEQVQKYAAKAYALAKEYAPHMLDSIFQLEGELYEVEKKYELAEQSFQQGIIYADAYNNLRNKTYLELKLGSLYLEIGHYEKGITMLEHLVEAQSVAGEMLKEVCYRLGTAHAKQGNINKVAQYFEQYAKIDQTIIANKTIQLDATLELMQEAKEVEVYKTLYYQNKHLYNMGQKLTSKLCEEAILKVVEEEIKELMPFTRLQVVLQNEMNQTVEYRLRMEEGEAINSKREPILADSLIHYCTKSKVEVLINEMDKEYDSYCTQYERSKKGEVLQSVICVPIVFSDQLIGVIQMEHLGPRQYTTKDSITLKMIGSYMGIALENARLYQKAEYDAQYDNLTQIFSRKELLRRSRILYEKSQKMQTCTFMMVDIDDFKKINDAYGHQMGDKVLAQVAQILKQSIRCKGVVGRYGGEEFLGVATGMDEKEAEAFAQKIRRCVEGLPIRTDEGEKVKVTISIGLKTIYSDQLPFAQGIACADKALYEAKNTGKNKVVTSTIWQIPFS